MARLLATSLVAVGLVVPLATRAPAATQVGFKAQSYDGFNAEQYAGALTGQKPESKLWYNAGIWWAAMLSPSANGAHHIFKLSGSSWVDTGTLIDSRPSTKEDVLWTGSKLYIISRASGSVGTSQFRRYSYSGGVYTLDAGFPVQGPGTSAETTTIARDSAGVLWATYEAGNKVQVVRTTTGDNVWGSPFTLSVPGANNLDSDDISAVISFTDATGPAIGVMWSNQKDQKDYFAVHRDGQSDSSWSGETALSGSLEADDHISLKTFEGKIYAAVKTSASSSSAPLIRLLIRSTSGSWSKYSVAPRSANNTRPITVVNVNPSTREVYVFMTLGEGASARGIGYKKTSIDSPNFPASPTTFIQGPNSEIINDATSTKQNVDNTSGLVVLASDTHSYWWNKLDLGAPPPPQPPTANPDSYSATTGVQLSVAAPGVLANDTDPNNDPLTAVLSTGVSHGTLALGSNGSFTYTATGGYTGTDSFTYKANDGTSSSSAATVTINVSGAGGSGPIVFQGASTGTGAAATSIVIGKPSGTVAGDVLIASVDARGNPTVSGPSGWTLIRADQNSTAIKKATFYHVATGSEPSSYTFAMSKASDSVGGIIAYGGVDTANPIVAHGATMSSGSTSNQVVAPSVNTVAGSMVVGLFGVASQTSVTPPAGMTERWDRAETGQYKATSEAADVVQAAAGATGSKSATSAGNGWNIGQLIALRPA
jgi:VCBS repeat-containing protein